MGSFCACYQRTNTCLLCSFYSQQRTKLQKSFVYSTSNVRMLIVHLFLWKIQRPPKIICYFEDASIHLFVQNTFQILTYCGIDIFLTQSKDVQSIQPSHFVFIVHQQICIDCMDAALLTWRPDVVSSLSVLHRTETVLSNHLCDRLGSPFFLCPPSSLSWVTFRLFRHSLFLAPNLLWHLFEGMCVTRESPPSPPSLAAS